MIVKFTRIPSNLARGHFFVSIIISAALRGIFIVVFKIFSEGFSVLRVVGVVGKKRFECGSWIKTQNMQVEWG